MTTATKEAASFAAYGDIGATIGRYVDGARGGDIALMRSAFSEAATVRGSYGGTPVDWTLQEFCAVVEKVAPPLISTREWSLSKFPDRRRWHDWKR